MTAVHCIVPARMGSSRFYGKPLFKICKKEMIVRTLEQAKLANCFERIVCATDSELIADVVSKAGFEFILTGIASTGSDRVAEAAKRLNLDLVVNLQGDEPLVHPSVLKNVANELILHRDSWITVACPLNLNDLTLETVVKVKVKENFAIDFSRLVPKEEALGWFQHQGIYAYSKRSRDVFFSLPQSKLELERSLEQMRILGKTPIRMVMSEFQSISVDVPSDAYAVEALIHERESLR